MSDTATARPRVGIGCRAVGPCIQAPGVPDKWGYGRRWLNDRYVLAHRLAWIEAQGLIPDGLWVLHQCDNPGCINTDHLWLGTHSDNIADMVAKGRANRPQGHRNPSVKVTASTVRLIRAMAEQGIERKLIAARVGLSKSQVRGIVNGHKWAWLP